ncbi:MAG: DUF5610 domain-containing protein [Planctomycetota bacterium]|nr:DUF5610 domain-containing protein [Planctomycetota bacterium]
MINNDITNPLERYFASGNAGDAKAADYIKQIRERRAALNGKAAGDPDSTREEDAASKSTAKEKNADANLSPEERRQKEIKAILDKINAEETQKRGADKTVAPNPENSNQPDKSKDILQIVANGIEGGAVDEYGFPAFLNDLPIFDQFKTDLLDAFKRLDGATAGSISAQFELNYSSVRMIANEFGGYDLTETSYSFKLDLNYLKAASGSGRNASLAELFGGSKTDKPSATGMVDDIKDYFSPANTADRILDFAASFFPMSDAFKKGGDTEDARSEFAQTMRDAIQKGFDQAMGKLGKVSDSVQDGIDETHRLTFQGIDDFVKYGMGRGKENKTDDLFAMLQQFSVSMEQSYAKTVYSYAPGSSSYGTGSAAAAKQDKAENKTPAIDAEA